MALPFRLRPVLVRRPRVQHDVVRDELHVTGLELHVEVEAGLARDGLVDVEELALARADRRVGVARGRAEVVAVVERAEPGAIPSTWNRGHPAGAAVPLVAAIERNGLVEPIDEIGAPPHEL